MPYRARTLETFIAAASKQMPVLLLTGARQVGKTTFLRHLSGDTRTYVTLDDPKVLSLAKGDTALFLQRFTPPLLIDEIQYSPELLPFIKMEVDKRRRPGSFWITGSQQFQLMKGVSESLAGRVGMVNLLGLSRQEMAGKGHEHGPFLPTAKELRDRGALKRELSLKALYKTIWRGAFPAIALNPKMNRDLFYGSYVQTYLQRDVRDLAKVGDKMAFLRFLRAAAARTGQLLNLTEIGRDAGVVTNTAKNWLSILQASGIVYLLEPYHTNVTKRLVKAPKLYFMDTGLCAYLTEWAGPETLEAGAMSGAILETWVMMELLKSYWHHGLRESFFFFRDRDLQEIDLLIVRNGTIYPLEVKKTASPSKDDVRNFQALKRLKMPVGSGGVICLEKQALPLTEMAWSIPVALI